MAKGGTCVRDEQGYIDSLIERARDGDEHAFGELLQGHRPMIRRTAFAILKNDQDVDDVVQDVSLKVFEKLHTFEGKARFSTWLISITVNVTLMRLRKARSRPSFAIADLTKGDDDAFLPLADGRRNPEQQCVLLDLEQKFEQAIARLPCGMKEVALDHLSSGLPLADIARKHDISLAAVKSRAHRARIRLRLMLHQRSA